MPKIILEQGDIERLIKEKYPGAEIVTDILEDFEIIIRVEDFQKPAFPATKNFPTRQISPPPREDGFVPDVTHFQNSKGEWLEIPEANRKKKDLVIDGNNNIDAEASGLTLPPRERTLPGGAMGRTRGALPKF
jgi:hypothetical protein